MALCILATLAATPGSAGQQRQVPSPVVGTVSGDWLWEPVTVPTTQAEISAPQLIRSVMPGFPAPATARQGYRGHVIVAATITATGEVAQPRIVRTPAPGIFDETTLAAVQQWRFRPATREGVPVAVTGIFTFHFEAAHGPAATGQQGAELTGRRANAVRMGAGGLVAPRQISTDLPEYTEAAEQAGIQGDVYIEAVVTREGTVAEPKLIRGLADDELNRRALEAITRWRFEPGRRGDEPVDVIALFTVTFRVH